MIVADASAVVDLITDAGRRNPLRDRLSREHLLAPDFLPIEVASAFRGMNLGGDLSDNDLDEATRLLQRPRIDLHESLPLVPRALALRGNFSAYDASYVALARPSDAHCSPTTGDWRKPRRSTAPSNWSPCRDHPPEQVGGATTREPLHLTGGLSTGASATPAAEALRSVDEYTPPYRQRIARGADVIFTS
ncbi:type II toxin-antitoxin system VapC family toxin [Microbacterium esteraromaticum]|uniref:type II toxin-antitoxin system VapC family toxin n=1 Tax=Microbacterium esteraromaticum TaxID=57043 RepID=UPI001A9086EE|nr:type II toxin-antitoxin system VapC family toxin [Microbacterium esteraromaticum]MBN8424706.1 type II toxin-antitoxin system VapC family toxin [Microbacterium esteraromaticum]